MYILYCATGWCDDYHEIDICCCSDETIIKEVYTQLVEHYNKFKELFDKEYDALEECVDWQSSYFEFKNRWDDNFANFHSDLLDFSFMKEFFIDGMKFYIKEIKEI